VLTVLLLTLAVGWPLDPVASQPAGSPVGGPVVLTPSGDAPMRVQGVGSYRGSIELRRRGDAVAITNELDLEAYVAGIAEVPPSWPMEALKAQAVAARTYALWEKERGVWQRQGFDVCGTTSCQVYTGLLAENRRRGERWLRAVRETAGEVLLHDGAPILARYHASSGGRTLANEVVYPSSGPRPYLKAVDDPADRVSPLHRWSVDFTQDAMQGILADGVELRGTLVDITADEAARRLEIRTEGGRMEMNAVRFRREVSEHAPKLFPDRYPGPRPDGRLMPLTLPSSRFEITKTDDGFRIEGRGYGHGVGMSQWGAKGRAEDGATHADILAAYYGGLRPERLDASPRIRVGLRTGSAAAAVFGDEPFGVTADGDTLADSTLGTWTVTPGPGRALRVRAPEGFEVPLVLSLADVPRELTYDPPERGRSLNVSVVVPKSVRVSGELRRGGESVASDGGVFEAGTAVLRLPLDGDRLARRGSYTLTVTAFDGTSRVSKQAQVRISKPGPGPVVLALRAFAITIGAGAVLVRQTRRRRTDAAADADGRPLVGSSQSSATPVRGQRSPDEQG
jgi:stage II sporulation protein D